YISYSHTDKSWHQTIRKFLASDTDIQVRLWDDSEIPPGADFATEIAEHLARAAVIVMLTSPAYLHPRSGAIRYEIRPALEAASRGETKILWVPVKSPSYAESPVGHLMAATGPGAQALELLQGNELNKALIHLLRAVRQSLGLPQTEAKGTGTG